MYLSRKYNRMPIRAVEPTPSNDFRTVVSMLRLGRGDGFADRFQQLVNELNNSADGGDIGLSCRVILDEFDSALMEPVDGDRSWGGWC